MSQEQFIKQTKSWIYQKLYIASKSKADKYQEQKTKNAIRVINEKFGEFLKYPSSYSMGQIAILVKRHQDLLELILPIPGNRNFENSVTKLSQLIAQAEQIINHLHLTL